MENLENENGNGKVMEHTKLAKSHGILLSVMEFYQFIPLIVPIFLHCQEIKHRFRKYQFSNIFCKTPQMQNR